MRASPPPVQMAASLYFFALGMLAWVVVLVRAYLDNGEN
jgi:hypothetical protein